MMIPNPLNFLGALWRTGWARLRGYDVLVTPDERDTRLDYCDFCPWITSRGQCRKCSCFVVAKTALAMEKCPAGRWAAIWRKKSVPKR